MPRENLFSRLRRSMSRRSSSGRTTRRRNSSSIQNLIPTVGDSSSEGRVNDDGTISYPDPENVDSLVTWIVDRNGNPVQRVIVIDGQLFPYHPEAHTLTKTASEIPVYIHKFGRKVKISNSDSPGKSPTPTAVGVGVYNPGEIRLAEGSLPELSLAGKKGREKTQKKRRSRKSKKRNKNKKR